MKAFYEPDDESFREPDPTNDADIIETLDELIYDSREDLNGFLDFHVTAFANDSE